MKAKTTFLLYFLFFICIIQNNQAQNWELVGLDSMVIYGLEVSGDTIWAGTYDNSINAKSGLYKSVDQGQTWVKLDSSLDSKAVTTFSIDKGNRSKIFIIKGYNQAGYFYRTTNNGSSWDSIGTPGNAPITDFIVSPINSDEYYTITYTIGHEWSTIELFHKSTDGGISWEYKCCPADQERGIVMAFAIDKTNPNTLFISGDSTGPFFIRSTDRGETWQNLSDPFASKVFIDFVLLNRIYLFNFFDKIYSDDGGLSWQNMDGEYTPDAHFISFYQDSETSIIYARFNEGLYYSDNDDIYWRLIPGSEILPVYYSGNMRNISTDNENNLIYVGTASGIYRTDYVTEVNEQIDNFQPVEFYLAQNYPNPFNPSTTIEYSLPKRANVQLIVYNILGKKVLELANRSYEAGSHSIVFDAKDLPSGVYFYQLVADNFYKVKKMQVLK